MPTIDLNSDLGEEMPADLDDALLALVSSANVACGGHAGDPETMRRTARVAVRLGVRLGAHPGYPDRAGFGRTRVDMDEAALVASLSEQIAALTSAVADAGGTVRYLKPHGALYNDAFAGHPPAVRAVVAVATQTGLPVMMLPGSPLEGAVPLIAEGFVDRAVRADGSLVPRTEPGALITDPDVAAGRALALASSVASLSVHSDTPGAVALLSAARGALERAGYRIGAS